MSVDSLITAFDSQNSRAALSTANQFFEILNKDGFTDPEIQLNEGCTSDQIKALTWYWAGEWYFEAQDFEKSMSYSSKALELAIKLEDKPLEADCCNIISILYFRRSDYPEALRHAKRTLEIGRSIDDISRISYSLNTLAGICLASRQPEEGEKYILEAIRLCEQEGDSLKLSVRCGMAAEIYHSMGQEEKSLEYSRRAYDINKAMGMEGKAATRLAQMAGAMIALERYDEAEKALREALPILENVGNVHSWAISSNLLGDVCLHKGEEEEAASYYTAALDVFSSRGDIYNEIHSRLGLGKALMHSDPTRSAQEMMIYGHLRDSLYDIGMHDGLNEWNAIYGNDILQQKMDRHKKALRWTFAAVIPILILLGLFLFLLSRKMRATRQSLNKAMERITSLEAISSDAPPADASTDSESGNNPDNGQEKISIADNEFLLRLTEIVKEVIESGNLDYDLVASKMCISRAHLNRKVKVAAGCTTTDFILAIRISKAKQLLGETSLPIWEIAQKCGFNDQAYFSTIFKKTVGCTPLQFRNGL
ncbi:MAG: tetratricopeptide repeat protein [Candidatus Cryptobacteroides sp.]